LKPLGDVFSDILAPFANAAQGYQNRKPPGYQNRSIAPIAGNGSAKVFV
jgi:hypothetical protein